jgi:drug/metabolite transporter (DMT)-like permease
MIPSLLTVLLFALSAVAGERTARYWGSERGNLLRLFLATVIMGTITLAFFPASLEPATYSWLFVSGMIGFGFGDIALFLAYVRIGSRLTILLNLCTAPLWSALLEAIWLGNRLTLAEAGAGAVILGGVAMAILSREPGNSPRLGSRWVGVLCGLAAGCGQGLGAVISRKAFDTAHLAAIDLNGFSAAAQRVSGGFATTLAVVLVLRFVSRSSRPPATAVPAAVKWKWLLATTLCGPILGVSCFQWALADWKAGVVTAITATTPIAMIPLAMAFDGEKPRTLSVLGAIIAVAGVLLLLAVKGTISS